MDESQKSLLAYINQLDPDEELKKIDFDEIELWIKEEWSELVVEDGVSPGEATSIIIDSNYKWTYNNSERKVFVLKQLLELNYSSSDELKSYLETEIKKLMVTITEKKSKNVVEAY